MIQHLGEAWATQLKPSLNKNNKQHKHLHTIVMLPHQQVRARLPSQAHYAHHREKEDTCTHIDLHLHRIPSTRGNNSYSEALRGLYKEQTGGKEIILTNTSKVLISDHKCNSLTLENFYNISRSKCYKRKH